MIVTLWNSLIYNTVNGITKELVGSGHHTSHKKDGSGKLVM